MNGKTLFFFNECVPIFDVDIYTSKLKVLITDYILYLSGKPIDGIFHTLSSNYDWSKYFEKIEDKRLRALSYRLFSSQSKMPVDETELLSITAHTKIDSKRIDNPFCYIAASFTDGFLFTIPTLSELEHDKLPLFFENSSESQNILSYYGQNVDFVLEEIESRRQSGLSNLEKLKECLQAEFEKSFCRSFEKLCHDAQDQIVNIFIKVKSQDYKPQDEGSGMREVTKNSKHERLYELKVFRPKAIRVYFSVKRNVVYLALIGDKATQDRDISTAQKYVDDWWRK